MKKQGFQKRIENFVCDKCNNKISGTGYTDHCPKCLWSKHTDIMPGDRKEICQGPMEPIAAQPKADGYVIYYQCQRCGFRHRVKSQPEDSFEEMLKLINKPLE